MSYEPTTWARGTKITATKLNNIEQGVQSVNSEYTPTTWAEGDIVTATKLNNIEQGIANASGGGGGGDSDLSTAEVTFKQTTYTELNDPIDYFACDIPVIYQNELSTIYDETPTFPITVLLPLYKGSCIVPQIPFGNIAIKNNEADLDISGNITHNADARMLTVTGNCEIGLGVPK